MGLATECRFTNDHRLLNRAIGSARQGSRMLWGLLITGVVPPGAPLILGADDTVARRNGRKSQAKGGDREAMRSTNTHGLRCFGVKWVSLRRLVPGPWSRRVWALPLLTALCRPVDQHGRPRHKTSVGGVRQLRPHVRRWLPGRQLVLVVDGGFAAVALALAGVKRQVTMVSRLRWDAARYHPPGPQPLGTRGPKPLQGKRQRHLQGWGERADTPWPTGAVDWYGGQRQQLWGFSRTTWWYTPGVPPVDIRDGLGCDPAGTWQMAAFCGTDLQATPVQMLSWVVRRWSVAVTCEEARAPPGWETQGQGSDLARARTTPVLLAVCSIVTRLALRLSPDGRLWRARYVVTSAPEAECGQFPREAFELLSNGLPFAAY